MWSPFSSCSCASLLMSLYPPFFLLYHKCTICQGCFAGWTPTLATTPRRPSMWLLRGAGRTWSWFEWFPKIEQHFIGFVNNFWKSYFSGLTWIVPGVATSYCSWARRRMRRLEASPFPISPTDALLFGTRLKRFNETYLISLYPSTIPGVCLCMGAPQRRGRLVHKSGRWHLCHLGKPEVRTFVYFYHSSVCSQGSS